MTKSTAETITSEESDRDSENRIHDPIPNAEIGSRIARAASMLGDRKTAARLAGTSVASLQRYISAGNAPFDVMARLAKAAGVSLDWLAWGDGDEPRSAATGEGASSHDLGEEFVLVRRYNVSASAGGGKAIDQEQEIGKLAFRRDWLRRKGLNEKDLCVITVSGDSMAPTIDDGAMVLVDTSQDRIGGDGIYILLVDGHLVAKRLQQDFKGGIYIRSDNPAYREEHLTAEEAEHLYIIGRVIWSGGEI